MTLIETPFGHGSTALEVIDGIDLTGKQAIVTGGASGIGVETARALASAGAEVTIAARKLDEAEKVAADIKSTTGNDKVGVRHLDLLDQASARKFGEEWDKPLHILVNNAGVMALPDLQLSPEGWEVQFATNHLGHFTLAQGLHQYLADDGAARIVSVSSSGHLRSPVHFDDINFENREYTPFDAYGQSKTANVLFAVGVTRKWADDGITSNSLMPGGIMTNLQRHMPPGYLEEARKRMGSSLVMKTTEQGASTSVLLATSPQLEGIGGKYFEDCNEAELNTGENNGSWGVRPYALDPENADRLWELSLELTA